MYKKARCTCRLVVLLIKRIALRSLCRRRRDFVRSSLWMPRRRRQGERQKSNWLNMVKQKNNSARASRFLVHFFAVTARLRREISRFIEDVNKRRVNFLSLSDLEYSS